MSRLARNGVIAYEDGAGDIYSLDPASGATKLLVGGPGTDVGPTYLPDGQNLTFYRIEEDIIYLANPDGSDPRALGTGKDIGPGDFSPRGDLLSAIPEGGGDLTIIDVASGRPVMYPLTRPVHAVSWLTEDTLLLIEENAEGSTTALSTINVDGTNQQAIDTPFVCCATSTIRGRSLVAWTSWNTGVAQSPIHILDTSSGEDTLLASTDVPGSRFLDPGFSPDGKWLTVKWFQHVEGFQLALIAADGSGEPISLGPVQPTNSAVINRAFSPDGTQLLVTYEDGSAWLFDLASGTGAKTDWPGMHEISWQALDVSN